MNKQDAERSLKVLNSDLVNFVAKIKDTPGINLLEKLSGEPTAPVPFQKNSYGLTGFRDFNFNDTKGVYYWNEAQGMYERKAFSDSIIVNTEDETGEKFRFFMPFYQDTIFNGKTVFPLKMKVTVFQNEHEILTLDYSGSISDDLPEFVQLGLNTGDGRLSVELIRTKNGDKGTVSLDAVFQVSNVEILKTWFRSNIGYSKRGYYLNELEVKQSLFQHIIKGYIDYSRVDPTAVDYAESFNRNSRVELFESNRKVGDLILALTDNNELLDYYIEFSDGSEKKISEYVPYFGKLLTFKY